jgi:hypothetical protein
MSWRKWVRRTRARVEPRVGTLEEVDLLLAPTLLGATRDVASPLDPTTSGWVGQALALVSLLAALVVLLRWWFANRRR